MFSHLVSLPVKDLPPEHSEENVAQGSPDGHLGKELVVLDVLLRERLVVTPQEGVGRGAREEAHPDDVELPRF